MIKGCKYIVLFFIAIHVAYAQNHINYNENNGLPSNHIYRITQDKKGFIWIGTDKGLVKYNGKKFTTFTTANGLQSSAVWNVLPTPSGKIWFLSKTSKIGYIKNDSVHIFPSNVKNDVFNPIYTGVVGDSVFPNGPHKSFVFDIKNKQWKRLKNIQSGIRIQNKKWDVIYQPSKGKKILLINYHKKDTFQLKTNNDINDFYVRHQLTDSLFLLLNAKKYLVINLNTQKVYKKTLKDEVGIEFSRNVCANYVNNEIQISGNGFVGKLNKYYGLSNITYTDADESLNTNNSFIDKQNTLWIATFSNGIYKLPEITQKATYSFPKKGITKLRRINNHIIALVQKKGFYKYNETKKQFTPHLKNSSYLYDCSFISDFKTNYYLGVKMTKIEDEKGKITPLKYPENISGYLRSLHYWKGFFYAHSSFGIYKIAIKKQSLFLVKNYPKIGTNYITKFKNSIVVATNSGLKQIKNDSLIDINITYTKKIKYLFTLSKNQLLMTTDGDGAFITDLNSIKQIPETQNLIVSDAYKNGNTLWLATNKGVQEYQIKNNSYSLLRTIDKRYGLPTNKTNSVITTKNRILIATNLGVIDLPLKELHALKRLDVYVENIFFNRKKITNHSQVNYEKNSTLEVEMGVIDFSEDKNPVQYNYKLDPIDKKWYQTTSSKLNFNNLPPNEYRLLVKVKNISKSVYFVIKPQWYQTWPFYVFIINALIVFIIFITAYVIGLTQKRKNKKLLQLKKISELELKALRSQMNPHFVFNSLTAIQYYINQNDYVSSDRYLVKFSRLIRNFFELSKEQTISIKREKNLLNTYLELEKMRFKGKLSYQIEIQPELNIKAEIPTMLLQPVVENAINHGIFNKEGTGFIKILFQKVNENTLSIIISDDGVGIERTQKNEKRFKSTSVLTDRIQFLNDTQKWRINIKRKNLYENKKDKGHTVIFTITKTL